MRNGFTYVELLVVMGIMAVLMSLSLLPLSSLIPRANSSSAVSTFVSDFRSQQQHSMLGKANLAGDQVPHGIKLGSRSYELFAGPNYAQSDESKFTINLDNIELSSSFPSDEIVFSQGSGEVISAGEEIYTVTLTNTSSGQSKTITFNKLGVVDNVEN